MALSFRTARKIWMGIIAVLSLVCIFLAFVLWAHGYSKSNNFVLGLFAFESDAAIHSDLIGAYEALVTVVWTNATLVFVYAAGIILLALLTQFSYDQDIWSRDIDSSPCPFPFAILIVYAFPSTAKYFHMTPVELTSPRQAALSGEYCLPGCPCHTKLPDGADVEMSNGLSSVTLPRTESYTSYTGSTRSTVPIRVPTAMERRNPIPVTLNFRA
ncbi:hypothetical protein HYDPIDRAFT_35532 [Hydnomerulius pinastri MD-312]|nr:hypothetical protein HYDPIDRAFT_35532 [Hydnomerulius pinastri MD-312]